MLKLNFQFFKTTLFYKLFCHLVFKGLPLFNFKSHYYLFLLTWVFYKRKFRYFKLLKRRAYSLTKPANTSIWPYFSETFYLITHKALKKRFLNKRRPPKYRRVSKRVYKLKKNKNIKYFFKNLKNLHFYNHKWSFLKYINLSSKINFAAINKPVFALQNRFFLNSRIINKAFVQFFYKKYKFKLLYSKFKRNFYKIPFKNQYLKSHSLLPDKFYEKKLLLANFNKKLYWKLRSSRKTHWDNFVGNRLNKYRYQKFFKKCFKMKKNICANNSYVLFLAHLSGFICSWRQIFLLISHNLIVVNGKFYPRLRPLNRGDILETCFGKGLIINFQLRAYFNKKIFYRLKRWSHRNWLNFSLPKSKRIFKKTPKSLKSILLAHKATSRSFMFSKSLGIAAVIYLIPDLTYEPTEIFYRSTILKLNNWRYKF